MFARSINHARKRRRFVRLITFHIFILLFSSRILNFMCHADTRRANDGHFFIVGDIFPHFYDIVVSRGFGVTSIVVLANWRHCVRLCGGNVKLLANVLTISSSIVVIIVSIFIEFNNRRCRRRNPCSRASGKWFRSRTSTAHRRFFERRYRGHSVVFRSRNVCARIR